MKIHESLERVLASRDLVGDMFYDVFLQRFPEVQRYFVGVDMHRQGVLLTTALLVVEQYYRNPRVAIEKYLQYLGTKHHDREIPRELYDKWVDAMLETLHRFHGDEWNQELSDEWREAFGRTIELMFEGYEQRFTV